ncbi:sensor histidine kinase [Pleionea mediterranea]|uniref:histidine kinase n=1 Tax=Pleionea mediterranea TaxID=523701 RepID=A0A316FJD1_9GAMM|nr:sensor histidine kinase [Pleionea mediterranea]PWK48609.1 histidine kinase [Pleionea mediterranea]
MADSRLVDQISSLLQQQKVLNLQLQKNNQQMQLLAQRIWDFKEQEQKQLAKELHDGVGQILTALINRLNSDTAKSEAPTEELELARQALQDIRDLSRLMRPPILDDLGLEAAIKWLARQMSGVNDIKITVVVGEYHKMPESIQTTFYRICQEALTNTIKHAAASHVFIKLDSKDDGWHLLVSDNGCGFELADDSQKGVGLSSIKDRVSAYSGRAIIETTPDEGCSIKAYIPMASAESTITSGTKITSDNIELNNKKAKTND